MKKRTLYKMFLCFSLLYILSCKSAPKDLSECVYIMVYDYENNALKDVQVLESDQVVGTTDIYGRYSYEVKDKTPVKVSFYKPGYEKIEVEIENRQNQVLYVKLGSASYYADLSEKKLDEKQFEEALKFINKALDLEKRKDYEYLKEIIIKRNNNEKNN